MDRRGKKTKKIPAPIGSRENLLLSDLREVTGNLSLNRFIGERLLAQCFKNIEAEFQFLHGVAFQLRVQVFAVTTVGYLAGRMTADFGDDALLNSLLLQVIDKIVAQTVTALLRVLGDILAVEILEEGPETPGVAVLGIVIHLGPELNRYVLLVSAVELPFRRIVQKSKLQENRMNRRYPYAAFVFHSGSGLFGFGKLEAGNSVHEEEDVVGEKLASLILAATAIKHNQRNP